MRPLRDELTLRLAESLMAVGLDPSSAAVAPTNDSRFGDYQSNTAMALAKVARANPREIAGRIINCFPSDGLCEPPTIAGAGFINFRLVAPALEASLASMAADDRLGVPAASKPLRILLDFSSPNVAKPMHIGHIRSTILGDCLARVARFLGHSVITDNHIGDWGTQFGKVIYGWKHLLDPTRLENHPIAELVRLYREVNAMESGNPDIQNAVRRELVKLQSGDPENLSIWKRCVELSLVEFERIYNLLDISFDEQLGESFYNNALGPLCDELEASGLARLSEGALCIFFSENSDLANNPAIIRKSDGGFLYATTDLATIRYRIQRWQPDEIWYVVGAPQALHFRQIFEAIRMMGITVNLRHIAFGSILGEDRKIMKTRSGDNIGLSDVLEEALDRAGAIVESKNPELSVEEKKLIAESVGLGAVKYAELSQHRMTDYVFSWDKMLAFQGNTAPYLQNACVRIHSIFRKAGTDFSSGAVHLGDPTERALAIHLLRYAEAVPSVLEDYRPNLLSNYLYELAETFHSFYEACPVLQASSDIRSSRLGLCKLTLRILTHGLSLMGIRVPERM
ncbi:MAG: arginine--tRNA ligase [Terrimicrobiaceae bacterium]